jgi:hypothetical protein
MIFGFPQIQAPLTTSSPNDDHYDWIVDLVTGAATGMKIRLDKQCVSDSHTFLDDVEDIIKDFEKGGFVSTS